ncbi:MAG: tRNA dihydrouridine synthase DusB [Lachnospiraceae bacterium]
MKKLKIGNVIIDGNLILAPMAGVTDLPFRLLCKEEGASLLYTEMISAKGIYYGNKNTELLWTIDERERPVTLQLFGSEPELLADIAMRIEDRNFDIIDINMGCPVPKIVNNKEGSALMNDMALSGRIIDAVSRAVKKPVTVKFRKGFYKDSDTAEEFARMAEYYGAKAVAVHPRTREQYYSGKADWDVLRRVKKAVSIPVIGNGDLFDVTDIKRMYEQTGVDAFMIGRGARGNPWIFKRAKAYIETGEILPSPSVSDICEMILKHAKMNIEYKGEYTGIREMRKHAAWYTQGLKNSAKFRDRLSHIESYDELCDILEKAYR